MAIYPEDIGGNTITDIVGQYWVGFRKVLDTTSILDIFSLIIKIWLHTPRENAKLMAIY